MGKDFYSKGEPREALVPQAMLTTQDWILPVRYGDEFATKPPFSHWISAAFSTLIGEVTEVTTRLPAAVLSLLALIFFYTLIRKEESEDIAFLTSLILLTSIEWHRASITSRVDMTLSAMCIFALVSFYNWEKTNFRGFPLLALVGMTGAILSKGPIGLILPSAIAGAYFLTQKHTIFKSSVNVLKIAAPALALSSLWYLAAYRQGGEEFWQTFMEENFARFQGTMEPGEDPHNHSAWYLYGTLIIGSIPWSVLIIFSFMKFLPETLKKIKIPTNQTIKSIWNRFISLPAIDRFSLVTILFYLAFFSIPSSKRSVYILPVYPFVSYFLAKAALLSIAIAPRINALLTKIFAGLSILMAVIALTPFINFVSLPGFISSQSAIRDFEFYKNIISASAGFSNLGAVPSLVIVFCLTGVIYLVLNNASLDRYRQTCNLAWAMSLSLIIANISIVKIVANGLSAKVWVQNISSQINATFPIYSFPGKNYGLNFYMKGALVELKDPSAITSPSYVFVSNEHRDVLVKELSSSIVTTISESPNPIEKIKNKMSLLKITAE